LIKNFADKPRAAALIRAYPTVSYTGSMPTIAGCEEKSHVAYAATDVEHWVHRMLSSYDKWCL